MQPLRLYTDRYTVRRGNYTKALQHLPRYPTQARFLKENPERARRGRRPNVLKGLLPAILRQRAAELILYCLSPHGD